MNQIINLTHFRVELVMTPAPTLMVSAHGHRWSTKLSPGEAIYIQERHPDREILDAVAWVTPLNNLIVQIGDMNMPYNLRHNQAEHLRSQEAAVQARLLAAPVEVAV